MTPIAAYLLGRIAPPAPDHLRAAGLAAHAYATLPADHPARPALRLDYLAALARHHHIRREVAPLLAAWCERGIEALPFKGFHLAELVYPAPGMRFHGDVDVRIRPEDAREARAVARALGWTEGMDSPGERRGYSHAICTLHGPGGAARVDLHRLVLHSRSRAHRVQRRITEAVWGNAQVVEWDGMHVRVPRPEDALLVLALQRAWGDGWRLKPSDPLDVRVLAERMGEGWRERVGARARALGCERTLGLFLGRCDPEAGRLVLEPPTRAERWRGGLLTLLESPFLGRRWMVRAVWLPRAVWYLARALPTVLRVRRALRRHTDLAHLLDSLTPAQSRPRPPTYYGRALVVKGVQRAVRLFPRHPGGVCLVRSLAIYTVLRRQGWPAELVTGVRRAATGVTGHAWVELDGGVLPELAEPHNAHIFAVQLRHPPAAV